MMLLGSKVSLSCFMTLMASSPNSSIKRSLFPRPTPCSPVHVPPTDMARLGGREREICVCNIAMVTNEGSLRFTSVTTPTKKGARVETNHIQAELGVCGFTGYIALLNMCSCPWIANLILCLGKTFLCVIAWFSFAPRYGTHGKIKL